MFGFGKSRSTGNKDQFPQGLSKATKDAILSVVGSHSIPSMPLSAQRAFSLAVDPAADSRDFVEVIESDEALSARVIKIANSVFFDRGKRSETIDDAVTVIGLNELRCLLNATTLSDLFPSSHPHRATFWTNDIATALISRELSRNLLAGKEEVAFLGGLMHDLGKLLLLQRTTEIYGGIISNVEEKGVPFHEAELVEFPFNHTEVGSLIGERWNFTAELLAIIRHHHDSWEQLSAAGGALSLPLIVKCADLLAHALGLGHGRCFVKLQNASKEELQAVWQTLGVEESSRRSELERLRRVYEAEYDLYAKQ